MPSRFPPLRPQERIVTRIQALPTPNLPWGELLIGTVALLLVLAL